MVFFRNLLQRITPIGEHVLPFLQLLCIAGIDIEDFQVLFLRDVKHQVVNRFTVRFIRKRNHRHRNQQGVRMIFTQPRQQLVKVLGKILCEVLTSCPVVQTVPDEDIIQARQFGSITIIAARIKQPLDIFATQTRIDHITGRQIPFRCQQLLQHFFQMRPFRLQFAGNTPLRRTVAE